LEHTYFSDGDTKKIAWRIITGKETVDQERDHVDKYLDKVTNEQSKYIALHVGIFWGIGRFIIKNEDIVKIMIDSKSMFDYLSGKKKQTDPFIRDRTKFIKNLMEQRKLVIKYVLIEPKENQVHNLL